LRASSTRWIKQTQKNCVDTDRQLMRLENEQKTSRNKLKDSSMDRMEGERRKLLVMLSSLTVSVQFSQSVVVLTYLRHGRIS
jgi:hypothetical protein